jgi:hypothetical protein
MPVAPKLNQAELQAVLDNFSFDNPGSRIGGSTVKKFRKSILEPARDPNADYLTPSSRRT